MIGCGGMARVVLKDLFVQKNHNLSIKALYDPSRQSITDTLDFIQENNPDNGNIAVADNCNALVERNDIEWVLIASVNSFHAEQVLASLNAGKHVFCQKPLVTKYEDCLRLVKAAGKSGKMLNMGFTLRYSPHYRKIKELLDDGVAGDIISMEFNETLGFDHGGCIMGNWRRLRELSGTHILEKCCHDIDIANWMSKGLAMKVSSFGGNDFFIPENEYHISRIGKSPNGNDAYMDMYSGAYKNENPFLAEKDIFDNQVAIIEYDNNVRATFHTNCNAGIPERRMYICGTEGAIRADVMSGSIEYRRIGYDTELQRVSVGVKGNHGGGDEILGKELLESIHRGTPPKTGLMDGIKSAVTCFGIDEAADNGKVVQMAPYWKKLGIIPDA